MKLSPPKQHDLVVDLSQQPFVGVEGHAHIFLNTATKKYTYSDETQWLNEREYDTIELAEQALRDYCAFSLDGPFLLEEIKLIIKQPVLREFTAVHVAERLFKEGRGEDAILTLRGELDKLSKVSERLAVLVRNNPQVNPLTDYTSPPITDAGLEHGEPT